MCVLEQLAVCFNWPSLGEILIDLICGWLACMYSSSSPSYHHMVVYSSLLSSARRSSGFWAGGFFCAFWVRLKGCGSLLLWFEEPLTLLDNYVPNQTPPSPRFDPSRGELVCLKGRLGSLLWTGLTATLHCTPNPAHSHTHNAGLRGKPEVL